MHIDLQVNDEVSPAIRRLDAALPHRRQAAVDETLRDVLADTVRLNPVDTARSRAAWVESLEQLGGRPPAGWRGPHPSAEAEGRTAAALSRQQTPDTSQAAAGNAVSYVPFLEYGTSRMSPFAMVRRSLALGRRRLVERLRNIVR